MWIDVKVLGSDSRLRVLHPATSLEEIGESLARHRCLIGDLVGEGEQTIDPPIRILTPATRIHFIAEA